MTTDYPLLAHLNLLDDLQDETATYSVTTGADGTGSPFSDVSNHDLLRPALPYSDGAGDFVVEISLPAITSADVFIVGAHRHETAGFKTTGATFDLEYWNGAWTSLISAESLTAENKSNIYKLAAHTLVLTGGVYKYRLSYAGLPASGIFSIPELFLGTALEMPPVNFGYDPYNEVYSGSKFESLSGRVYKNLHYRRLELLPSWSVLHRATYDTPIHTFREETLETLASFWWAWQPDTSPSECYFMLHNAKQAAYPLLSSIHRSLSLKLVEDV